MEKCFKPRTIFATNWSNSKRNADDDMAATSRVFKIAAFHNANLPAAKCANVQTDWCELIFTLHVSNASQWRVNISNYLRF